MNGGGKCRVCGHPRRTEIEAAADGGRHLREIADAFGLTERGLQRHYATHGRAGALEAVAAEAAPPASAPSPEVVSDSARVVIDELLRRVRKLMADAEADPLATYRDRSALLTTAGTVAKLLGQLTGEFAVSEASIVASPQWRRVEGAIVAALTPYPEAAAAVALAVEGLL